MSAALAAVVVALVVGRSVAPVAPVGAAAPPATVCVAEEYTWIGQAPLAPGETFDTGVTVPAEAGTQLAVRGVDYSTDVVGSALAISVGQQPAASGVAVAGGSIAATNGSSTPVVVISVGLAIERCHQVDQAPAQLMPPVNGPAIATAPAVPAVAAVAAAALAGAPVPPSAAADEDLPNTGATSTGLIYGAGLSTALGVILVGVNRRRSALARGT